MTVEEFFATVRSELMRGGALDALFPQAFRAAIRFIESNYTFAYMRQSDNYTIASGTSDVTLTATQSKGLKEIEVVRWLDDQSDYHFLKQVDAWQVASRTSVEDNPTAFELLQTTRNNERAKLTFDAPFGDSVSLEVVTYNFTSWDGDLANSKLWLLNNWETPLRLRMMIALCPAARAPDLLAMLRDQWQEWQSTMIASDDALRQSAR